MPAPSTSLATLRPDLAASFMQFDLEAAQNGFIAQKVMPVVEVGVQAGNFGVIPIDQLLQASNTQRASGSNYNRSSYTFQPGTFATKENGFEEPVDDREAKIYANYFDAEQIAAGRARYKVLFNYEKRAINLLTNPAIITNTSPVATSWKTLAGSTVVADGIRAKLAIWNAIGRYPNVAVVGFNAFANAQQSADIISRLKYSGIDDPKNITSKMIAAMWGVDQVLVAGIPYNSADEGQPVQVSSYWPDDKVGFYVTTDSPDFKTPCVGRTFHWGEDGSMIGGMVETYRDEVVRADIVRCRFETDEKILYPQAGYILTGANT